MNPLSGQNSADEKLNARIHLITDRLIDQAVNYRPETRNWAWSVKVIDEPKTVNAFCMAGGKMVEHWHELDALGLLQQLGVMTRK